jgi:NitT/TauT family transport system permease protein
MFPSLGHVFGRFFELLFYEDLALKALYSIGVVIVAMSISAVLALLLSFMGLKSYYIRYSTELMNTIASPIPGIAILPIVMLWLGVSREAMMLIMIHAMIWPLWMNTALALERIIKRYERMIKAFRIPLKTRVRHIYMEGILPDLIVGLEIAWSRGWRALLSIEMIFGIVGSHSGLGWLIYERRMYMDTAGMFAGLIAIALCGITFESIVFKSKKMEAFVETAHRNQTASKKV